MPNRTRSNAHKKVSHAICQIDFGSFMCVRVCTETVLWVIACKRQQDRHFLCSLDLFGQGVAFQTSHPASALCASRLARPHSRGLLTQDGRVKPEMLDSPVFKVILTV